MLKRKNKTSLNEHLARIKFVSKHVLGEAKYNPVFEMDVDDELDMTQLGGPQPVGPNDSNVMEADDDEEITADQLDDPTGAEGAVGDGFPGEGPEPPVDSGAAEQVADVPDAGMEDPMADPMAADPMGGDPAMATPAVPSADEQREELQNSLIKLQVSALEQMNSKMQMMDVTMGELKGVMGQLSQDVEEVREPTNVEKVAARKEDSHPYYYRLNDLWQGNTFQARMDGSETEGEYGMKQLEDGTYVADFDSFPELNDMDLKKSF